MAVQLALTQRVSVRVGVGQPTGGTALAVPFASLTYNIAMDSDYERKMAEEFRRADRTVDVPLTMFGNRNTLTGIVSLLGYIRSAINSNEEVSIVVSVGKTVKNDRFDFLLDGEVVPDMKVVNNVQIN